ncbi:hypothetical protein [Methylobacterium nodulans]|uniref:Uncharacterized protein n=1 Tax=Methylobacterium nodulans (strain LMG 21967 / CNCM I-2342 / ORS 2060) TaxID=460265 RepID=B8IUT0_METNO|nr:hypothetical protein [Methylobacterium nodulans]ACL57148.1 conserved hypothetical protein [Methylobacterium nodulans ORS 2060]
MSLRLNLATGTLAVLGFGTVCAVSAVNLDRLPSASAPIPQVAAVRAAPAEPAATGSIAPAPVPSKPRAKPAKAEAARDPAFDSERLAQLLSAAAAGTARPIDH